MLVRPGWVYYLELQMQVLSLGAPSKIWVLLPSLCPASGAVSAPSTPDHCSGQILSSVNTMWSWLPGVPLCLKLFSRPSFRASFRRYSDFSGHFVQGGDLTLSSWLSNVLLNLPHATLACWEERISSCLLLVCLKVQLSRVASVPSLLYLLLDPTHGIDVYLEGFLYRVYLGEQEW